LLTDFAWDRMDRVFAAQIAQRSVQGQPLPAMDTTACAAQLS